MYIAQKTLLCLLFALEKLSNCKQKVLQDLKDNKNPRRYLNITNALSNPGVTGTICGITRKYHQQQQQSPCGNNGNSTQQFA